MDDVLNWPSLSSLSMIGSCLTRNTEPQYALHRVIQHSFPRNQDRRLSQTGEVDFAYVESVTIIIRPAGAVLAAPA